MGKKAQLMLMMLGVGAACGKKEAQLMLMTPGVGAAYGKKDAQLMLMMLAWAWPSADALNDRDSIDSSSPK